MSKVWVNSAESYGSPETDSFLDSYFSSNSGRLKHAARILLKPNLLSATPPDRAVTTHPDFVRAVVKSVRKYTDAELLIGDSPGANFGRYDHVLEVTGMAGVIAECGLAKVRMEACVPASKNGRVYASVADEVDLIVNMAKLKTHSLTGLTLAVKNMFGLVPGTGKVGYHRNYPVDTELAFNIYEFFTIFQDKMLNVLDGILAHEGDGPSRGKPVLLGIVAASDDAVALDAAVTRLLGLPEDFCLTTLGAKEKGCDTSLIEVENACSRKKYSIKTPVTKRIPALPPVIKKWVSEKVFVKPFILEEKCIKCNLCVKSCPVDAIRTGGVYRVEPNKCVECFCCHEVCESDAVGMRRSFLHKVFVK
jgi:uncharacterized protein (DUF362 family)